MADLEVLKEGSIVDSSPRDGPELPIHTDSDLERRTVRKLDYTLLPVLLMFYIVFIDFTNYGNARVAGLQTDLKMTDAQFQASFVVGLVTYTATQLPSNLILRGIGPGLLLPSMLMLLGAILAFHGLVTSYAGLVAVRAVLGFVEGPILSGFVLYLSGFYTRQELSVRVAFFFSTGTLSGTFSSLLAAAIEQMDGIGGRSGWAWLFIVEGLFTVCMGLASFLVVPSTPRASRFLTVEQKDTIMARLERDRPSFRSSDSFNIREVLRSLSSPHVILVLTMHFMAGTIIVGLAVFLPSIVSEMGHSQSKAQLLSAGPPVAGFFITMSTAFWSDRHNSRGIPVVIVSGLSVVGFALYLAAKNDTVAYGALYIISSSSALAPLLTAWMANNSEPHYRRATSIAMSFLAAGLGSILSIWIYPSKNGPKYRSTTILNLVFSICIMVVALINMLYLSWRNGQKQDPGYRATVVEIFKEEDSDGHLNAWVELGDKHPDFRYTL